MCRGFAERKRKRSQESHLGASHHGPGEKFECYWDGFGEGDGGEEDLFQSLDVTVSWDRENERWFYSSQEVVLKMSKVSLRGGELRPCYLGRFALWETERHVSSFSSFPHRKLVVSVCCWRRSYQSELYNGWYSVLFMLVSAAPNPTPGPSVMLSEYLSNEWNRDWRASCPAGTAGR